MTHGSESPEFRRNVSRLAGPRELTPEELARAWHETKCALAPSRGFPRSAVQPWASVGLQRRKLEEDVAEALLVGRIAEHVQARGAAEEGVARLSKPVGGVCREFIDAEVRDAVMDRAGGADGTLTFTAALRMLLLQLEAADDLARTVGVLGAALAESPDA